MGEQVIIMPVVALRGLTILPGMVLHFDVNRPKSVAAVEKANGLVKRGLQWTPPHEQINQMLDIMGSYASRAQAGEMTAQEACDKAQADVLDLLK